MKECDRGDEEQLKKHNIAALLDYVPNAVVCKTILKKVTGDITIFSVADGETVAEKLVPFDTYVHMIEGSARFMINNSRYDVEEGEGMIIPSHRKYRITAGTQFKMICTIIKSGYEE